MSNFAYLHVHSHFSRSGGPAAPAKWCRRAAELGYDAIGFADRSPLAGLPAMHRAAGETGLRPVYGIEIDLLLPDGEGRKAGTVSQPALLISPGLDGIPSLARIASEAYSGWPGTEKALAWDALAASAGDLVLILLGGDEAGVLTPCATLPTKKLASWAKSARADFQQAVYVGIPHSGRQGDSVLADQVCSAASALELPVVAMPTARYLRAEDAPGYEALKVARRRAGWPHDDAVVTSTGSVAPDRPGHDYLRSPEEAAALFSRWPEALENLERILETCHLDTERGPFKMEASQDGIAFLKELALKKLQSKLSLDALPAGVAEQLDNELDTIEERAGAWTALERIVEMAQAGNSATGAVPLGAPTGAASGSLPAYALGISPIMPTIGQTGETGYTTRSHSGLPGLEVPSDRRDAIVAALAGEYGPGRLAQAACALPVVPAQAVQAAGIVLGLAGDPLKSLALATIDGGWEALSPGDRQDHTIEQLASLALTLKRAPLIFIPDPDTLLAAPRQTHGATALSSFGPTLAGGDIGWMPWAEEDLSALGYPAFTLRPAQPLAALDTALALARRYPVPGFQVDDAGLQALPALGESAIAILHKGELAGVPYLNAAATKAWSGEATFESAAQLVARSHHPKRPPAPDPRPALWDEITAATGGTLLFRDQLIAILSSLGISVEAIAALWHATLVPQAEESEAAQAMFVKSSGLDAEATGLLWNALCEHAKLLVARDAAAAWGRTALWLVALKADHPAAFLAGTLSATTVRTEVTKLASEARRLGIKIEQPDINRSAVGPVLQRDGDAWSILWGLNHLPGWHGSPAAGFLAARPAAGFASLREAALAAADSSVSQSQLETLIRSGACDDLGTLGAIRDRDAMLEVLPAMLEWARATRLSAGQLDLFSAAPLEPPVEEDLQDLPDSEPRIALSPRQRYLRKLWEEANVGVAFTQAVEMETLVAALEKSGDLRSRLLTTAQIGEQHVGTSISMVGILCSIHTVEGAPGDGAPLAYGRLEDAHGSIELVAFPPNYKHHSELWTGSDQVIVTARVSRHDDGEMYLLSEHIAPFQAGSSEEAMTLTIKGPRQIKSAPGSNSSTPVPSEAAPVPARPAPSAQAPTIASSAGRPQPGPLRQQVALSNEPARYSLIISLPPADDDHEVIDSMIALNSLLGSHPGSDSVTIRVQYSPETGKWTSARLPGGVRFSQALEQSIRRLLGEDALAVIKLAA